MKTTISITNNDQRSNGCRVYFNKAAIKLVGFDSILFLQHSGEGGLMIKRPAMESKLTYSIKYNQFTYATANPDDLVGKYTIVGKPNSDVFYLKKIK